MSSAVWRRNADVYKSSSEEKRPALRNQIWTNQLRREKQFEHKHHGDYIVQTDLLRPVHIRAEEQAEKGVRKKSEKEYKCRKAQRKQRVVLVASLHTQVTADVQAARVPSLRVEMALKLKGIEYEYIEEDMNNKSTLLLESNPVHKKVPVLLHNGKPIAESLVILEYINETWENGPSILPRSPYDRAMARFWANFLDDTCLPACMKAFLSEGEEQVKAKEEVQELLKFLDNELNGKKFFGGERIGFVDIAGNVLAYWCVIIAELVGIELITDDKFPHLCTWMEVYLNSSLIKEHMPDREKLADSLRARFQKTG
ncbi:putative glutathione S-transferase [Dorcoceras hygrometricum]|uniref:glutathione transferase n=1 Tax=Dorcoceras hygrometricum TaxID=472368 RepID=A0A2Z7ANA8_9LAMI|nr:putative glutathione S-transferase [Dorcoceras hygrometricum]